MNANLDSAISERSAVEGPHLAQRREATNPEITVIVPVYNEAETVIDVLQRAMAESTPKEILIVDDGSTDLTLERIEQWRTAAQFQPDATETQRIVLLKHSVNLGKGAAIRTALLQARARFVIVQDADLEVSPDEYPWLIKPLVAGEADIVIGYRTMKSAVPGRLAHGIGIWILNLLVRLLYGVSIRDEACCFKVLQTRDLLRMQLACNRFEFCPEVVAKAARLGLRFTEVPVAYTPRDACGGKKLQLRDGLQAMWTLWKYRRWRAV